ncbi:pantoate--beta-alanine ligase [Enterococcus malodoratus]|uniref:Pantothenate synthetase n=1 Tax=Enterococcus malodoratus ATCC 43197 TaxID=1158601 RepID=R2RGE5_9ENTE|nr:pantoate--beta-alanine ligase [Enterococcus malodoratus]EOH75059.1 pantoate-beta-alanine ligase [Enterococcus malodoratus ATCC 43197]EOT66961.1 pantoate-beta-alanine ligase [Enterococcus malodoratus ATCC 43197]OJG63657.1 pantoate-beta-alanine ligase [Enterococcus malodoratus]SPX03917.1 pantoate--beta-alanine ligase [Enterococcus malodoratus]STD69787.1 pantoate--beta-alanine ligase [Enterococcus malodoratus]
MQTLETIQAVRKQVNLWRQAGETIGLVPTMGALHAGHQSLIERAAEENDHVIVSIFVNPTQFAPNEDLTSYPRKLEEDQALCEKAGVEVIFHPEPQEMYPSGFDTFVEVHGTTEVLEGASRPTHFRGVTTIVLKLLQIAQPDRAYFGQKDAQQVAVIQQMVRDLNVPVEIIACPIIREVDGLAKSSRNVYLNPAERKAALVLSRALNLAQQRLNAGTREPKQLIQLIIEEISKESLAKIDYVEIVDQKTLQKVETINAAILVPIAVYIGNTRLIDNFYWEAK